MRLSGVWMPFGVCLLLSASSTVAAAPSGCVRPMPDLMSFIRRTTPRILAHGRVIKGIYYSETQVGPHLLAAFYMACDQRMESRPFLIFNFRSHEYLLDLDQDSCADQAGDLLSDEIDPADLTPRIDNIEGYCAEDVISSVRPPERPRPSS